MKHLLNDPFQKEAQVCIKCSSVSMKINRGG